MTWVKKYLNISQYLRSYGIFDDICLQPVVEHQVLITFDTGTMSLGSLHNAQQIQCAAPNLTSQLTTGSGH